MKTALLDGDVILHKAVESSSAYHLFGESLIHRVELAQAKQYIDHEIAVVREHFGVKDVVCAVSATGPRWRATLVNPMYKGGRPPAKPVGYAETRDYMMGTYPSVCWPPLEGDDVLGILATCGADPRRTGYPRRMGDRLVVSIDKDLMTIPGKLARSFRGEVVEITPAEAEHHFYTQALMGDSTDGYKGCPDIGAKRAAKALAGITTSEELWFAVLRAYEKAYAKLDRSRDEAYADALMNARCAYILRDGDYDVETQEITLWEPPI